MVLEGDDYDDCSLEDEGVPIQLCFTLSVVIRFSSLLIFLSFKRKFIYTKNLTLDNGSCQ